MNSRKSFTRVSIRDKLLFIITLIVSAIAVFIMLYFPAHYREKAFDDAESRALTIADMLAFSIAPGLEFEDVGMVYEALEGAKINKDLDYIVVYDRDNREFVSFNGHRMGDPDFYTEIWESGKRIRFQSDRLNVATPILSRNGLVGTLLLGLSLKGIQTKLEVERGLTLLVCGLIILLGYITATILANRLSKPIKTLEKAAKQLSEGKTGLTISVKSSDEIGTLADSFNEMSVNLHQARKKLEGYNQTLEMQVQKRTAELSAKTRELEERNLELIQANRAKSEFLATTSHELRTPLNSILGFARLIVDDLCETRNEEKGLLKDIQNSAIHLLDIINNILDLSKIEAGKMDVNLQEMDPNPVIEEILMTMKPEAEKKGLDFSYVNNSEELPSLYADPVKFRQILINILVNALKFTGEGSVTLRVEAREERSHVWFTIEDTGIGIPEEAQEKVFHMFTQADGSFTRRHEGTGLGLAISKRLVELNGGQIILSSEGKNRGTKVSFTLPVYRPEIEREGPEKKEVRLNWDGCDIPSVLIAENDVRLQNYLKEVLRGRGYRVLCASTAEETIRVMRSHLPEVILLDVGLPSSGNPLFRDGMDVLMEIEKRELTGAVKVLIITGHDESWVRERLKRDAIRMNPEIIQKPISVECLVGKLIRWGVNSGKHRVSYHPEE